MYVCVVCGMHVVYVRSMHPSTGGAPVLHCNLPKMHLTHVQVGGEGGGAHMYNYQLHAASPVFGLPSAPLFIQPVSAMSACMYC